MSRMFPFITVTWNPIGGECEHQCIGCWAGDLIARHQWAKYQGDPRIDEKQINRRFKTTDFVFVQDMTDLFANNVPASVIQQVLDQIAKFPETKFLLLTKNPERYRGFVIPHNCTCGATIETNLNNDLANAPRRTERIQSMRELEYAPKMVSVEPIRYFTPTFFHSLFEICPEFIAVGYDNYNNGFVEPTLEDTEKLITTLEALGIKVYRKTLREPKTI